MPFEHACFVSYRHHEQSEIAERFISDLAKALRNELELRMKEGLFIDRQRMRGGTLFNPALSHALCKSVCMIAVYTPTYFCSEHIYCAREYRAMEKLEEIRLTRLQLQQQHEGFIIPVILRGEEYLPPAIREHRHYYTFERFALYSREIARNRQFEDRVREIAKVIDARRRALAPFAEELTCDCHSFAFPTEEEVRPWVEKIEKVITSAKGFPFRRVERG